DAHLATIELPSVSWSTYIKHVRLAVELATAGALTRPPSQARDVEIVDVDTASGTASLLVTGPIPEIQGLAHRLDVQARTVQRAQRAALEDGGGPGPVRYRPGPRPAGPAPVAADPALRDPDPLGPGHRPGPGDPQP